MLPVLLCVAIPLLILGIVEYMRSQFVDEIFGLAWPVAELNNSQDNRLIKLRLSDPVRGEHDV